jgi:signal transduction histidine kinase
MQKVRSNFFSSVAHELRTPLNSIIPLLRMILDIYGEGLSSAHAKELIRVVLNSALHLQNVIEDALDVSRLENNKFQLFKDHFSITDAVKDVCEIMEFQFRQKKLQLILNIKDRVPKTVFSDVKRFK